MTIEILRHDMAAALKAGDKLRKEVLSSLVDAVGKAAITPKGRIEITEDLVNTAILKEQKTIQEMIDTCPPDRTDRLESFKAHLAIVSEYAPKIENDPEVIKNMISSFGIELTKSNRGKIMSALKGKADMKVANQIVANILS